MAQHGMVRAMDEAQHLKTLISVLVGVALSNQAMSVHHLLRDRQQVRWDWLAPCTALLATLLLLHFWFEYYSFANAALFTRLGPLLLLLLQLLLLVLLACGALPDAGGDTDLRRFYNQQAPVFWMVASAYVLGADLWSTLLAPPQPLLSRLAGLAPDLLNISLFLLLALVRRRRLHEVLVPLVSAWFLVALYGKGLG